MLFSGWSWHTGTDQSTVCENISMKLQPSHPFCQCQCHILRWLADRSGATGSNEIYEPGSKLLVLGMVIQPLIGNPGILIMGI